MIRFVDEYMLDLNGTQAAIRAGYSQKTAKQQASQMLEKPEVQQLLQQRLDDRAKRTGIMQDAVLQRLWAIATANPNDLVQYRRTCCRYCHGKKFQYQWTKGEYKRAQDSAIELKKEMPGLQGGLGFDARKDPNPDCPECFGNGQGRVYAKDTRKLTGDAALLYAGAKQGKEGLEIKMHDRVAALEKVGQHLGMFKTKHELSGPNGGPIETVTKVTRTIIDPENENT